METLVQDIHYGLRMLVKNPGFTIFAILTLALGIGANTAIFSVVNAELLRPLPFRDPGRLVRVWNTSARTNAKSFPSSYPDFVDWRSQSQVFESMAAYTDSTNTLTGTDEPAHLETAIVSAQTFDFLDIFRGPENFDMSDIATNIPASGQRGRRPFFIFNVSLYK